VTQSEKRVDKRGLLFSAQASEHMTTTTPVNSRRLGLAIAGLLLGFFAGYVLTVPAELTAPVERGDSLLAANPMPAEPADLLGPSETRSPKQVVEIQMQALAEYRNNRVAIHQVFAHASPTNRAVTGPLQRFEQMILLPRYRDLTTSKHFMIGQAVQYGKDATVLVTTIDEQGDMSVFRFFLSLQSETYPGCWMTDGVFLLVGNWRPGDAPPRGVNKLSDSI
jgi:hypothetical protein